MEETNTRSTAKRNAVVTGANKGIGLEICRQLASNGVEVILTARDEQGGIEAVENLRQSGVSNFVFHQLDVKDSASAFIETHFGKLDILVNNAGDGGIIMNSEAFRAFRPVDRSLLKGIMDQTYEKTKECLETNFYRTKRVTEALLPLLQLSKSARIVNMSSFYGQLKYIGNEKAQAELGNIESLTVERLDETVFKVNCVHPGLVKTDMICNTGSMTVEEGARAPVMLAPSPDDGPSGLFYDEMNVSSF
ncbi:(+)-neomenthol dehydrogenase [Citrus sinensis]|nr:(+)-neomenthol dehydrogenase [Citrus sinensis]